MTMATIAYGLVFGALVALAAAALDGLLRLGGRATRGVWVAALGVTLAATALAPARVSHRAPAGRALAVAAGPVPSALSPSHRLVHAVALLRALGASIASRSLSWIPAGRVPALERWLGAAWIVASVAIFALMLAVHAHFRAARRRWPLVSLDGTPVRLAPRTGPAVFGLIAPEIVVPAWFVARTAGEQRLALDHEREHLRARDPWLLAAGYGVAALVPWHPAAWWMLARLKLAVELDCDARVLRRGAAPQSYGALLIDLAGTPATPAGVPVLGLTLTNLERRLIAMTPHRRPHVTLRRGALAATAVLAFAIACNAPVPSAPRDVEPSRSTPSVTSDAASQSARVDSLVLRLDGVIADAVKSESLRAGNGLSGVTLEAHLGKEIRTRLQYLIAAANTASGQRAGADGPLKHPGPDRPFRIMPDGRSAVLYSPGAAAEQRKKTFDGLVVIDGMVSTNAALQQLSPDAIERVDVLEHDAAARRYSDPRAAKGVIEVRTKRP